MGFLQRFKGIDVFRKVPKDLTEASYTGATVSAICVIFMLALFCAEFGDYWSVKVETKMVVDVPRGAETMHILVDLDLPGMACDKVSVDAQDAMGKHIVDVDKSVSKTGIENGDGCRLDGYISVNKVPGNFHISAHGKATTANWQKIAASISLNHKIKNLHFRDSRQGIEMDADVFDSVDAVFNPLDDTIGDMDDRTTTYEYYIQVVPTVYEKLDGTLHNTFQFTVNKYFRTQHEGAHNHGYYLPALYFRYEMSPITVKYTEHSSPFSHFIVQLCAIIGGVFSMMGIVASLSSRVAEKIAMGKAE
eukprot:TRINITY_DN5870_c0_g1_i1.p1 TRINITY_DN5870_c0_g1~~TRINITY_DN5870_c0_g1_i1.p1  ORF type:complete len:318 (+),score=76.01 TRINITY_DN5870_c0_g1_i1:40-954(+)